MEPKEFEGRIISADMMLTKQNWKVLKELLEDMQKGITANIDVDIKENMAKGKLVRKFNQ